MYLQITNICNMTCEHCCYSCTKEGEHMTMKVVREALAMGDGYITIGGGEPTLHPQFEKILLECIGAVAEEGYGHVHVITNGSVKKRALMLNNLARSGVIGAELSRDDYHDPISPEVIAAFEIRNDYGVATRNTTQNREPLPHGRAKEIIGFDSDDEDWRTESDCPCNDMLVTPSGKIFQCGCDDSPVIGNVWKGIETDYSGECCRSRDFVDMCIDSGREHLLV